ncbi:unnamed protein product [Closterium sp. NIES-54]
MVEWRVPTLVPSSPLSHSRSPEFPRRPSFSPLHRPSTRQANIDATKPKEEWNLEALAAKVKQYCYLLADLSPESLAPHADSIDSLREYLRKRGREVYYQKREEVEKIVPGLMKDAERYFVLSQTDNLWKEHLQAHPLTPTPDFPSPLPDVSRRKSRRSSQG